MKSLEHKIPPPAVTLLICILMGAVAWFSADSLHPTLMHYLLAVLVFVAGGLFGFPAFRAFCAREYNDQSGEYRPRFRTCDRWCLPHHPQPHVFGLTLFITTVALGLGNNWFFLGPILFVLFTTRFQIIPEERVMRQKFGKDYEDYCKHVRRWI